MPPESRFIFNGGVVALGAFLDQPRRREVRGAVALPDVGGRASVQEGPPNLNGIVHYMYASSGVSGERIGDEYETRGTCTMEGLEVGDYLRADLLSGVLTSRYADHHRFHEESVTLKGLWINGEDIPLRARMLDIVRSCPTRSDLHARAKRDGLFTTDLIAVGTPREAGKLIETKSGDLGCFLFEPHYRRFERNGIRYEIFIGELVVQDKQRRLNLLRIEAHPVGDGC